MSNQSLVVPFLSGQQLYCSKLSGLEENTRYRVLVVAANSVGKSKPVRLRFRTAIHGEYVRVHAVGSSDYRCRYMLTCKMLCDAYIWVHPNSKCLFVVSLWVGPPTSHTNLPHQYSLHPVRKLLFLFLSSPLTLTFLPTSLSHAPPPLPSPPPTPPPSHLIPSPLQLPLVLQPMSQSTARHTPWSLLGVCQRKRTETDRSLGSKWSCTAQDSQPSGGK